MRFQVELGKTGTLGTVISVHKFLQPVQKYVCVGYDPTTGSRWSHMGAGELTGTELSYQLTLAAQGALEDSRLGNYRN